MTTFSPGDWVRINWHYNQAVEGRTGTIQAEQCEFVNGIDDIITVRLDEPFNGSDHVDASAEDLQLVQPEAVITIVNAADDTTVAAYHDRPDRRIEVVCSGHGTVCTYILARDTTVTEEARLRNTAAVAAVHQHATTGHKPSVDSAGEPT